MNITPINLKTARREEIQYREKLISILEACKYNVSRAARKVFLSRTSMYRRISILSIPLPKQRRGRGRSIFTHRLPL